ncbi:hypothetical protein GobsT_02150 [Gemmata obscuriglobus]|uniref:Uncharacterized protein n=1 Tax=Gemmata obscuriglobus TaxID=114 RepID=A0A2Z3HHA2_9BACT|nr:hypothetical protein [Gemmata obscuriglobus]AWM41174.1 hypothetical protein C1280_32080 [Gemmata obscuriglobus]QEG25489.1 hypothetical protein GobsT_02150 [Gemmata obscuriglobus]VTR98732.1 unnamed protein product [Gemmata obscuriglobus UQM 2246]
MGRVPEAGGDQFYVTHCAVADSVRNDPGYTVRAASVTDPAALDAAFQYPPYELPLELWRDPPAPEFAPRRLARTKVPRGGRVWAVHSAYLAKDTVGRDRSYFSHLLLLPAAEPAEVLRSWGSEEWVTSYPPAESKALPRNAGLPPGELVNDDALAAFLNDGASGPTELSRTVCPSRLRASAPERRALFARMLRAMLLLAEEEDAARRRLFVHAEPGLVALLLYGAVRLLPPAVTDDLTFSTFEPHQRNLRDYKLAEVVGTYTGSPERGLEPDLGTTRGIALDTFAPARSSPELRAPDGGDAGTGLAALVELAAAGEWGLLPAVRQAVGPDPSGLPRAGAALARTRRLARTDAGTASVGDLLALQADPLAREELAARVTRVWAVVKEPALARPDVRAAFRELIARPEHARELWEDAIAALLRDDLRRWGACWSALRESVGADEARRLLDKLVGREKNEAKLSRLPVAARSELRTACADVNQFPPRALLVPVTAGELEPLLHTQPDWAGYVAFVVLADDRFDWLAHVPPPDRDTMRTHAREYLLAAPPAAAAAYVRAAGPFLDTEPALLTTLFAPYTPAAAGLMDRLLAAGALEPGDWLKLCHIVEMLQGAWGDFLLENNRLAHLLVGFGGDGAGRDVWAGYLELLSPALLSPDLLGAASGDETVVIHRWERKVQAHLRLAAERLTASGARLVQALPPGGVARLFAANALVRWVNDPTAIPLDTPDEVPQACDTFGVERIDLVRVVYKQLGGADLALPDGADELAPVVELFRVCFPTDGTFNAARRVASEAVRLSDDGPTRARGALQAHLILACVPDMNLAALIESASQSTALDPLAVERLRRQISRPQKNASRSAFVPDREEQSSDDDEDDRHSKGRKKRHKKAKKSGCLGLVLFTVVFIVFLFAVSGP